MSCVFCNSAENLNTQMTITLDNGGSAVVQICDEHAEDATVKLARKAYLDRQEQIDKVLAQAKALGLTISTTTGGISIAQAPAKPKEPIAPPRSVTTTATTIQAIKPISESVELEGPDVVSTDVLTNSGMRSVGGNVSGNMVESHVSHSTSNLQDKLDPEMLRGKAKLTVLQGREGQNLVIPTKRVDKTGTTILNIVKTENDDKLQRRFKNMASDSMKDGGEPDFARSGYRNTTRDCPICHGQCVINGQDCPKCKGAGIISVH